MSAPRLPWNEEDVPPSSSSAPSEKLRGIHICVHGTVRVRLAAVRAHVLAHTPAPVLLLAATRDQAADVSRNILANDPASFGVERTGWVTYSVRLAEPALIAQGLVPISTLGFEAVVARVVARARAEKALSYFAEASRHPGFVTSLAQTLADVRLAGLHAHAFGAGTPKMRDLAYLAAATHEVLDALRHADRAHVLRLACEAVESLEPDGLEALVLVDVPLSSELDIRLAHALITRSRSALVTSPDGDPWTDRLYRRLRESGLGTTDASAFAKAAADTLERRPYHPDTGSVQPVAGSLSRESEIGNRESVTTGSLQPAAGSLRNAQRESGSTTATPAALSRVQRGLFAPGDDAGGGNGDESVQCISAPGEGRECVELARALLARAEAGTPFDRIAIAVRAPHLYASHLETALRRAGIPAYFARSTRRPDPAGRAFLAVLTCALENRSASRFAEYLSLGQVPGIADRGSGIADREPGTGNREPGNATATRSLQPVAGSLSWVLPDDESLGLRSNLDTDVEGEDGTMLAKGGHGGPPPLHVPVPGPPAAVPDPRSAIRDPRSAVPDPRSAIRDPRSAVPDPQSAIRDPRSPWRWEGILDDAQVIGGDRWRRRLEGFIQELQLRIKELAAEEPDSPRLVARADDAAADPAIPPTYTMRREEWTREVIDFALPIVEQLASWPASDDWGSWLTRLNALAPRVVADPTRVQAVLAELRPLESVGDVSLVEVRDVLRDRLTHLPGTRPASRYGRVFIGTPDQLRGRVFDEVFVPGLAERVFPQRSRQDPLLLDEERAAIAPHLAVDEDRVELERLQLRLAAGAATKALLISYASMDTAQTRPRVPSFYAVDVHRAVSGRVPGYEILILDAQRRGGARLAWPAPHDPVLAIDAAEHDLAMLHQFLRGSQEDVAGRGRYLFDLNPALRRALVARHRRLGSSWSAHDGLLAGEGALDRHRLSQRAYSASALQRFATCPYQFYLSTILRLEPREEASPLTTLDALTRGSMVHEMLAAIMRQLIDRGWTPPPPDQMAAAHQLADAAVTTIADSYEHSLSPSIPRVWADAVAAMRRDVHEWLERLPEQQGDWTPAFVEWGFGFSGGSGRDGASTREDAVLADGTRLHGVVDLIERRGDGQWRITDYKTGRNRLRGDVEVDGGQTLQPVLYALAVEATLGGTVEEARLYFCTENGNFERRPLAANGATSVSARSRGREVLAVIDRAIASSTLPAAPRDMACAYCDFTAVCGPEAQKVPDRKDRKALGDLLVLRGWR